MSREATDDDLSIINRIKARGGEALRDGLWFHAGGFNICHRRKMERLARKGLVRIEKVGTSVFAVAA